MANQFVPIPDAGSAIFIRDGRLYWGPLNADGSCDCNLEEASEIDPSSIKCEWMVRDEVCNCDACLSGDGH